MSIGDGSKDMLETIKKYIDQMSKEDQDKLKKWIEKRIDTKLAFPLEEINGLLEITQELEKRLEALENKK